MSPQPRFLELALGEGTPTSALNTALVVRTILVAVNRGDATWGAVGAKRRHVRLGAGGR